MQQAVNTPVVTAWPRQVETSKGPVTLDPQLLKLVSGGSPKGGWELPDVTLSDLESPKGGW